MLTIDEISEMQRRDPRYRREAQAAEIMEWAAPNQPDEFYRRLGLAEAAKAQEQLNSMRDHHGGLIGEQDSAVAKHAEITGPLQEQLAAEGLTPAERIALRVKINQANAELESETARLKPLIAAAESEIELLRPRAGARQLIEQAACNAGSPEQRHQRAVLRKALDIFRNLLGFQLKRTTPKDAIADGAYQLFGEFETELNRRLEDLRQQRLRELYQVND